MLITLVFVAAAFIATGPADGSRKSGAGHRHKVRDGAGASRWSAPEPPRWLLRQAAQAMSEVNGGLVDAVNWGVPHDPELGDLTASGPDDPSTRAYALVITGDFPESARTEPASADATPGPAGRAAWRLYVYDDATHELGVYGEGPQAFDASAYPSLRPLDLQIVPAL